MSEYQAPIEDIMFILNELSEQSALSKITALQDFTPDLVEAVLSEAGKFANKVLTPLNVIGDVQGCQFVNGKVKTPDGWPQAYEQFCQNGWMGLALPEASGGQGLPKFIAMAVNEMWSSANMAFIMFHALNQGGSEILIKLGNDAQKSKYLEKLASGEWTVAMALTEPSAGSDLSKTTTKAIKQLNGDYLIKGQKLFITYGEHDLTENIVHLVLAKVEGASSGSKGLSLFAVPTKRINNDGTLAEANDVHCISIEHKMGLNGSPTCSMSYGDNNACLGELIGAEGKGLAGMFILMNEARLNTGLQGVAIGELAYQQAVNYALERKQGNDAISGEKHVVIAQHPDVKRMLLSIRSQTMALRALAYLIASRLDQSEYSETPEIKEKLTANIALLTPILKAYSTERSNLMAGTAIQIFGGMGFIEETGVAQLVRDVRVTTIYEGTTGIQAKDLLFRKIRLDNGASAYSLLEEIKNVAEQLATETSLAFMSKKLHVCCSDVSKILDSCINASGNEDEQFNLHSNAVNLLEAMGVLCCSWQMAKLALAAQSYLNGANDANNSNGDDENKNTTYHTNLIALAEFYFAQFTPQLHALTESFIKGSRGLKKYTL